MRIATYDNKPGKGDKEQPARAQREDPPDPPNTSLASPFHPYPNYPTNGHLSSSSIPVQPSRFLTTSHTFPAFPLKTFPCASWLVEPQSLLLERVVGVLLAAA
eukprot:758643-Hanusia_phi.AAC.2